jgi:hypothetical protein
MTKFILNEEGDKMVIVTEGLIDFLADKLKDVLGDDSYEKLRKQFGFDDKENSERVQVEIPKDLESKYNFHQIPDGKNNFRSAQLPGDVLASVIKKYKIKNVIRLNGDGNDSYHRQASEKLSREDEKKICEELNCKFEPIKAHMGYKFGEGYVGSLDSVSSILQKGNTLIHCAHGADRTGGLVGGYLKKTGKEKDLDKLWEYTTKYNGWKRMINANRFFGSGYDKYADTFYPIPELKKKYEK